MLAVRQNGETWGEEMSRRAVFAPAVAAALLSSAAVGAGENPNGIAWLSWDIEEVICDLDTMPTGFVWLCVQLGNISELAGCEVILEWMPPGLPGSRCVEFVYGEHPSGFGDQCTWLVRGNQVEGINVSDDTQWFTAFVGDECNVSCSTGNVARALFDFGGCVGDTPAWFCTQYVKVTDCSALVDFLTIMSEAAVLGASGVECPCCLSPRSFAGCDWADVSIRRSTWGSIKAMYK